MGARGRGLRGGGRIMGPGAGAWINLIAFNKKAKVN